MEEDANRDAPDRSAMLDNETYAVKSAAFNMATFGEQCQNEIKRITEEYLNKFLQDRRSIDGEITRLIDNERTNFEKLRRCLRDHRRLAGQPK